MVWSFPRYSKQPGVATRFSALPWVTGPPRIPFNPNSVAAFGLAALTVVIVLVGASCSKEETAGGVSTPAQKSSSDLTHIAGQPSAAASDSAAAGVLIRMKVVDMDGKPVANMQPIATTKPNAFDLPVAKGDLTGEDGTGSLTVPSDQYLYVRAWDPIKQLFANNYYDVLPGSKPPEEVLQVTMLQGASFNSDVLDAEGAPFADQPIGMMMSHPVHGPWWPSETKTDEQGRARFGPLPPGKYAITIESRDHRHVDLPEQTLLPGETTDAGPVTLR